MDGDETEDEDDFVAGPGGGALGVWSAVSVDKGLGLRWGATVRAAERVKGEWLYHVSYAGWGGRFDEWVTAAAVAAETAGRHRDFATSVVAQYGSAVPALAALGRLAMATAADLLHAASFKVGGQRGAHLGAAGQRASSPPITPAGR